MLQRHDLEGPNPHHLPVKIPPVVSRQRPVDRRVLEVFGGGHGVDAGDSE
jgi:hypothetical protein